MPWPKGRTRSAETIRKLTKYPVNDTLFDAIDNEQSAYWLGRLTADGGVSHNIITLSAAKKDSANIEQFRDWLSPGRPIRIFTQKERVLRGRRIKESTMHIVTICSKKLATKLLDHGIVPNKTLILTGPPLTVPPELLKHYYRGYFDSDGTISITARPKRHLKNYCHLSLLGTEQFLLCFVQWIEDTTGVKMRNPYPKKGTAIWRTDVDGLRRVSVIAQLLYGDAMVYLERKHARAMAIIAAHTTPRPKSEGGYRIDPALRSRARELYATGQYTIKQIATMVGIGYGTTYCIAHNVRYPQDRKPKVLRLCSIKGCGKKHYAQEYCRNHYDAFARPRPVPQPCTVPACGRLAQRRNLCKTHYHRFLAGQPLQAPIQRSVLSKEEEREILRLYEEEHFSQQDIMKMLGVGEGTVYRCLKRQGNPRRYNQRRT